METPHFPSNMLIICSYCVSVMIHGFLPPECLDLVVPSSLILLTYLKTVDLAIPCFLKWSATSQARESGLRERKFPTRLRWCSCLDASIIATNISPDLIFVALKRWNVFLSLVIFSATSRSSMKTQQELSLKAKIHTLFFHQNSVNVISNHWFVSW